MIDLDGLEEHLKEIIDDGRGGERYTKAENVMALVQRLRQAEKDAARYRFMRDMSDDVDLSEFFYIEVSERDELIDEAMNGSNN